MTAFLEVEKGYVDLSHIIHIGHDSTHGGTVTVTWAGGVQAFHIKLGENPQIDKRIWPTTELHALEADHAARDLMMMLNAVQEKEGQNQVPLIRFLGADNGKQRIAYWEAKIMR